MSSFQIRVFCAGYLIPEITESERQKESTEQLTEQERFWVSIGWTKSDSRPSAIATGTVVGLVCCVVPLALLCCSDLCASHRDLSRMWGNITGKKNHKMMKRRKKNKVAASKTVTAKEPEGEVIDIDTVMT